VCVQPSWQRQRVQRNKGKSTPEKTHQVQKPKRKTLIKIQKKKTKPKKKTNYVIVNSIQLWSNLMVTNPNPHINWRHAINHSIMMCTIYHKVVKYKTKNKTNILLPFLCL
jgi:hypothetical protein